MTTRGNHDADRRKIGNPQRHSWISRPAVRETLLIGISAILSITSYLINLAIARLTEQPWAASGNWVTIALLLIIAQAAMLHWRQRRPFLTFCIIYLLSIALTVVLGNRSLAAGPTLWIAIFFLAANTGARISVSTLLFAAMIDVALQAAVMDMATQIPALAGTDELTRTLWLGSAIVINVAVKYTICSFLGAWVALQRRRTELAVERTALIRRESEARVREAVARERATMARELHDVAAHHLSGIAVQSRAALHVHPSEPDTVGELLRGIRDQSQDTLTSLRQIVGILRKDEDQELSPQPMIEDIGELVESIRRLNTIVKFSVDGNLSKLSPAVSLACYRVVQESLSNVQKHASGASVSIYIQNHEDRVEVEIENSRPAHEPDRETGVVDGGFGLTGMRERVQILGGRFDAGPTEGGGWSTKAVIPTRERTEVR
ncbi:sensor histidine kinase [Devriesea agamarum]|uniref:sensor histidine kinase n=1 Tax=Devriesea agamarum TaxID=472569 RepID=UPI00071D333E|nr:histidine kinase [Devriesea agamarum]